MWWIILGVGALILVYWAVIKPLRFWKVRGVPHETPWPLFGNMLGVFFSGKSFPDTVKDGYERFPNAR